MQNLITIRREQVVHLDLGRELERIAAIEGATRAPVLPRGLGLEMDLSYRGPRIPGNSKGGM
jgi:hypothetical protein